jgi:collagenase-like PrtC family protease
MLSLVFKNSLKWTRHCREGREQPSPQARWLTNPKGKASNAIARFYQKNRNRNNLINSVAHLIHYHYHYFLLEGRGEKASYLINETQTENECRSCRRRKEFEA